MMSIADSPNPPIATVSPGATRASCAGSGYGASIRRCPPGPGVEGRLSV